MVTLTENNWAEDSLLAYEAEDEETTGRFAITRSSRGFGLVTLWERGRSSGSFWTDDRDEGELVVLALDRIFGRGRWSISASDQSLLGVGAKRNAPVVLGKSPVLISGT